MNVGITTSAKKLIIAPDANVNPVRRASAFALKACQRAAGVRAWRAASRNAWEIAEGRRESSPAFAVEASGCSFA
jgi:hypothetical protein